MMDKATEDLLAEATRRSTVPVNWPVPFGSTYGIIRRLVATVVRMDKPEVNTGLVKMAAAEAELESVRHALADEGFTIGTFLAALREKNEQIAELERERDKLLKYEKFWNASEIGKRAEKAEAEVERLKGAMRAIERESWHRHECGGCVSNRRRVRKLIGQGEAPHAAALSDLAEAPTDKENG